MSSGAKISGRRVLLVEDDYFLANDLARALTAQKIDVLGPFAEPAAALAAVASTSVDAAILDIRLADANALDVADALTAQAIPFVFATGVDAEEIPEYFHDVPRLEKPFHAERVLDWLSGTWLPANGTPIEPSATFANELLRKFPEEDIARLRPHMARVRMKRRAVFAQPNRIVDRVCFPESGLFSVIVSKGQHAAEVGLIGREGVAGPPVAMGIDRTPLQTIVQVDGEAIILPRGILRELAEESKEVAVALLRFQYLLGIQIAYTAFASAAFTIDQRLARWLLMCQDRVGPNLTIVHEFLSLMLHVRRPSVTTTLQALERKGAITSERGRLRVRSREKLLEIAGDAYGGAEAEQDRLSGGSKSISGRSQNEAVAYGPGSIA